LSADPAEALGVLLGLSRTEARVYGYLLDRGEVPARQIAEECGVSRGKIYTLLRALENEGLLERIPSKPSRFRATNPQETLSGAEQRFRVLAHQAAVLRKDLSKKRKTEYRETSVQVPVMLRGRRAVSKHLRRAIESAQRSLLIVTSEACLRRNRLWLVPLLRERAKELASLRILAPPGGQAMRLVAPIRGDAQIRQSPRENEGITACLVDRSSVVFCRWVPDDLSQRNETDYSVSIKDATLASWIAESIEGLWEKAPPGPVMDRSLDSPEGVAARQRPTRRESDGRWGGREQAQGPRSFARESLRETKAADPPDVGDGGSHAPQ